MKVKVVILGCTDLTLLIKQTDFDAEGIILIDSLDSLKEEMLKTQPENK